MQRYAVGQILKVFVLNGDGVLGHAKKHSLGRLLPEEAPLRNIVLQVGLFSDGVCVEKWTDGVTVHFKRKAVIEFCVDHVSVSTMLKAAVAVCRCASHVIGRRISSSAPSIDGDSGLRTAFGILIVIVSVPLVRTNSC